MHQVIQLTSSYYVALPKRCAGTARERYVRYYQDLYQLYGESLNEETFNKGSQYSYTDLGDAVLAHCAEQHNLADVDLMIIAAWAHEFDPEYGSCAAYFSHRYNMNCSIFDMSDQGTLSAFQAIALIKQYLRQTLAVKAMLLILEQNSIPGSFLQDSMQCASQVLVFEKIPFANTSVELVCSGIVDSNNTLPDEILKQIEEQNSILIQPAMLRWYDLSQCSPPGYMPFFSHLHQNIPSFINQTTLLTHKDTETNDIGYLLLRSGA